MLLSDGKSTSGVAPLTAAQEAGRRHIPIYTVALGTPTGTITVRTPSGGTETRQVPPDPATLRQIASASGGQAFQAADANACPRSTSAWAPSSAARTSRARSARCSPPQHSRSSSRARH